MVRMSTDELALLDGWIAARGAPFVTRPEAIRIILREKLA
jgi:hypothetical protein